MSNTFAATNSKYGSAKRKRGFNPSMAASKLSRKLFFKQFPVPNVDKAVGRALKSRLIHSPEQKFIEVIGDGTTISTSAVMTLLNPILEGDNEQNRSGAKVRVTKIEFVASLILGNLAAGGADRGLVSLFIKKQTNAAAPSALVGASGSGNSVPYTSVAAGAVSVLKTALQEDEYYIIKDWQYSLDSNASLGTIAAPEWQRDSLHLRCSIPLSRVIHYNDANGGTVADIIINAIYLGYVGSQTNTADIRTSIQYVARVWFTDM